MEIINFFIKYGVNVNVIDKYNVILLKYVIIINNLLILDNKEMYQLLLNKGLDYNLKDGFGKLCLDYVKEYFWRNDFLDIVKEYENSKK